MRTRRGEYTNQPIVFHKYVRDSGQYHVQARAYYSPVSVQELAEGPATGLALFLCFPASAVGLPHPMDFPSLHLNSPAYPSRQGPV